jgi:mono/diheme cytochrome c family protein
MKKMFSVALAIVFGVSAATLSLAAAPDGKELYSKKCAMCHGADGVPKKTGEGSKAFNDPAWKSAATVDGIVGDIKNGKGKMKPVKSLDEAQAKAIAEYILTLAK